MEKFDALKQSVMVNQYVNITGLDRHAAEQLLSQCNWQFEMALSLFFQGQNMPDYNQQQYHHHHGPGNQIAQHRLNNLMEVAVDSGSSSFSSSSIGDMHHLAPPTGAKFIPVTNHSNNNLSMHASAVLRQNNPHSDNNLLSTPNSDFCRPPSYCGAARLGPPANTPCTPPNFSDALLAFSKLSAPSAAAANDAMSSNRTHQQQRYF